MSYLGEDDDFEIVNRVKAGNVDAFGDLVTRYQKMIFSFCYRMLLNTADAEDAAQDSFIKAFRSIKTFKGESKFSTWLYKIATNTCLDKLRVKWKQEPIDESFTDPRPIPQEIYFKKEREEFLRRGMERLDEMHRVALNLVHFEGLSYEEASHIMGCEVGTVKSRVSRGMEKLGKLIKGGIKENKGKA